MSIIQMKFDDKPLYQINDNEHYMRNFIGAYLTVLHNNPNMPEAKNLADHFNLETLMKIPLHIYGKDKSGMYVFCNDNHAENMGFKKGEDIIGKKDNILCWGDYSKIIHENDNEVLLSNRTKLYYETGPLGDGVRRFAVSCKTPLYSKSKKIIGTFGISMVSGVHKLSNKPHDTDNQLKSHFKISQREYDCLYHLAYGRSAKQIAKILCISPRTVEDYLVNARIKLSCDNRSQLIEKVINSGILLKS